LCYIIFMSNQMNRFNVHNVFSRLTARYFNIEVENKKLVKTFFGLLSPWEIHILALAYEQQEVQNSIEALKEKFSKEVTDLKNKIRFLQVLSYY
jgi:hypothetical protein